MNRRPHKSDRLEIASLSAVEHLLAHAPTRIQTLYVKVSERRSNPRLESILSQAEALNIPVDVSSRDQFSDEPVRALLHAFPYRELKEVIQATAELKHTFVLVLDHLQDPQNFGALARSAEGLGGAAVVIPKDRSVAVTSGVYHSSAGAIDTIPVVQVSNLSEACRKLKENGFWVVGTALSEQSKPLAEMPDFAKVALVLGTELEGLSRGLESNCDWLVTIPLSGKVQSLNVSAAGAILMHELTRRWESSSA